MSTRNGGVYLPDHRRQESSQFGENGLVETIFGTIGTRHRICVDVGAQYLRHRSNVFPLWSRDGWHALLVEADSHLCVRMRREYEKRADEAEGSVELLNVRVTSRGPDRLGNVLESQGLPEDFDLLNVDVDGIDYHLWKSLEDFRPRAVVIEYNSSIPPDRELLGGDVYNSLGASLESMRRLAREKRYGLVALTPANALFVVEEETGAFEGVNDLERLWDPEHHGRFLTYAIRTFEEEVFFTRPPVVRDDYELATPESVNLVREDDVYFATPRPEPGDFFKYFFREPMRYVFHRSRWFSRLKTRLDRLGLAWLIRPFVRWFETYD